ncbi:vWA domain-containing protein [Acanthopleuribacter pedis]|uniref:vWA domain-containing protein n=1 Tax=Acanthopleuribacter pedis TaxID=442870 RepID=UPI00311CD9A9
MSLLLVSCLAGDLTFLEPRAARFAGQTAVALAFDGDVDELLGIELFVNGESVHYFEETPFETTLDFSRFSEGELVLRAVATFFGDRTTAVELKGVNYPHFHETDVRLVRVPIKVDRRKETDTLALPDFVLKENGKPQNLEYLLDENHPLDLVLVLDFSGSMEGRVPILLRGVSNLLNRLHARDRVQVIGFNVRVFEVSPPETNKDLVKRRLFAVKPDGATNLYGAVYSGVKLLAKSNQRRALLVFTDGRHDLDDAPDHYKRGLVDCIDLAVSNGVPIYTLGIGGDTDPDILAELALRTGGTYFALKTGKQVRGAFDAIGGQLSDQYLLCYYTQSRFQGWHDIEVSLQRPVKAVTYPGRLYFSDP